MNISKKFTLWMLFTVLVIGLISSYLFYRSEMNHEASRIRSLGQTVGQILERSLDSDMMTRDFNAIHETLHDVAQIKPISGIWLMDREGTVKISTDEKEVGNKIPLADPRCRECHIKKQKEIFLKDEGIFRLAQPIANKQGCHKCHDPAIKINGIFIIDFSLAELSSQVKKKILMGFLIFLLSLVLIGSVTIMLSKTIVIKRLNTISEKVRQFKEGDYSVRIPTEGHDEISELEEVVNRMGEEINTREREKELLFQQVSTAYEKWHSTFDSITDLISLQDADCNVIMANRAFCEYFGLSLDEVKDKKCHQLFHEADNQIDNCPHRMTISQNKPATEEVLDSANKKIFRISTYPFHLPEANFAGSIHIAKDITEEKEQEMRLILSDRLASLGQMASGIAHEINNPLASIAGCVEGLLNRVKKGQFNPELFENYLKIMEEEIVRCKGITTSMLSFVRKATYEKKDIDVNALLDKTVEIIGFQGRLKEIDVQRDYTKGLPVIRGSEGELRQVFLSIITNALDAMQDKGILGLVTGYEKDAVYVKISDSGPGMSKELIGKIFDPFFTTKSEKGGIGLGLSVAGKIITNHNGSIEVSSEEGKGTTFIIVVPV